MCYRKDRIEAENQDHLDLDLDLMPFKDLMRTSYQDLVRMGSGCWQDAGSGAGPVARWRSTGPGPGEQISSGLRTLTRMHLAAQDWL